MATWHVSEGELVALLRPREGRAVFGPVTVSRRTGETASAWLEALGPDVPVDPQGLRLPRAAQSPKGFLLTAAESVGRYGQAGGAATATQTDQTVVVGVRACELRAMRYLDQVMLEGEFSDPAYRARREGMTIVSCDCADCAASCCCTLVGGKPYPEDGYDVNLSASDGGWLVEAATEKGRQLLGDGGAEATPQQLAARDRAREAMTSRVRGQNEAFGFSADDKSQPALPEGDDAAWQRFAADCVECAACTNVCPTCHCFYLYDQLLGPEAFERVRTWDSCLLSTYNRMAGGVHMKLTPKAKLSSRLANRVLHKFTYSPQQYGLLGCVGCGRCIDACLGAIDIREVVDRLCRSAGETSQ